MWHLVGSSQDRFGIDFEMTVQVRDCSCLAEVLDAEGRYPMALNATNPGQGRRMAIVHGNDGGVAGHFLKEPFNMAAGRGR